MTEYNWTTKEFDDFHQTIIKQFGEIDKETLLELVEKTKKKLQGNIDPKPVDKEILDSIDVKIINFSGNDKSGQSNVLSIFTKNSSYLEIGHFKWLMDQFNDDKKEKLYRLKNLLLAIQFAKRNRDICDPQFFAFTKNYFKELYLFQDLILDYIVSSPNKKLMLQDVKSWVIETQNIDIRRRLIDFLNTFNGDEVIDTLETLVYAENENSAQALFSLKKFKDKRIYKIASSFAFSASESLAVIAIDIMLDYNENTSESYHTIQQVIANINNIGGVLTYMVRHNPNHAIVWIEKNIEIFLASQKASYFIPFVSNFDLKLISDENKSIYKKIATRVLSLPTISSFHESYINGIKAKVDGLKG